MFELIEGQGAQASMLQPDLKRRPLLLNEQHKVTIQSDGKEYFHVLLATKKGKHLITSAIRYFHMFGKPAGVSPSRLTQKEKTPLEIVPAPLPREHWQYMAEHRARFRVRFHGHALIDQPVRITTGNGTTMQLQTDRHGYAAFVLPDDFPNTKPGRMRNKPASLLLYTTHHHKDDQYITTLTADYTVNPKHWQSFTGGLWVAGGGMLLGGFISWRLGRRRTTTVNRKGGGKQV
ncbi:MAG: hypothetical protein R8L58_03410 [Mariprofundaceae bacterium]